MNLAVTKAAHVKRITALAHALKEDLGETIRELALDEARRINEKGLEAQVAFIVDEMGPEKAEEYIRSRHEDWNIATDPELLPEGAQA